MAGLAAGGLAAAGANRGGAVQIQEGTASVVAASAERWRDATGVPRDHKIVSVSATAGEGIGAYLSGMAPALEAKLDEVEARRAARRAKHHQTVAMYLAGEIQGQSYVKAWNAFESMVARDSSATFLWAAEEQKKAAKKGDVATMMRLFCLIENPYSASHLWGRAPGSPHYAERQAYHAALKETALDPQALKPWLDPRHAKASAEAFGWEHTPVMLAGFPVYHSFHNVFAIAERTRMDRAEKEAMKGLFYQAFVDVFSDKNPQAAADAIIMLNSMQIIYGAGHEPLVALLKQYPRALKKLATWKDRPAYINALAARAGWVATAPPQLVSGPAPAQRASAGIKIRNVPTKLIHAKR